MDCCERMVVKKRQVQVKEIPKSVLMHAIASITEGLVLDARANYGTEYGFKNKIEILEDQGIIFCEVAFIPYDYKFKWLVAKEKEGYLITLIGGTPGKWYEFVYNSDFKITNLVDTQWSAFVNFCVGFLTAKYYAKGKKVHPKHHIIAAKKKITSRTKHKKTVIG